MRKNLLFYVGAWSLFVFFFIGCKPDRITKWRYVPEEIDNAEVILTINETQGLAEVECTPTNMYCGIQKDSVYYHYWLKNGWTYQVVADTFYLRKYVEATGQNIIGRERMIIKEKTSRSILLQSDGFHEAYSTIANHQYIHNYKFERLP
ncbi:MAG: hypothetical protein II865_02150 [Bacteroidales bacterium]|jgi:hypothetical protein|nr:hypothetical protein [Bacteroidales bacterium]